MQEDVQNSRKREQRLERLQGSLKQLMDKKEALQAESGLKTRASQDQSRMLKGRIQELEDQLSHQQAASQEQTGMLTRRIQQMEGQLSQQQVAC